MVDVLVDERVMGLTLNGVSQPDGVYGSSESLAPNPDDVNFSGPGTVTVGPPPVAPEIIITNCFRSSPSEFTIEFTSPVPVDVYGSESEDGFNFVLFDSEVESGTYVDTIATADRIFYALVPTGETFPPDP